jgi:hypothetical protein
MLVSKHNIKDLGITLEQLYNEEKQINVHLTDKNHIYTLVLVGRDKTPDFLLSSFIGNYYARSVKGLNRQKYTSLDGIQRAVKNIVNKNINSDGSISFSLNDEISYF